MIKYSREELNRMADHEINLAVAKKLYPQKYLTIYVNNQREEINIRKEVFDPTLMDNVSETFWDDFDPCEDWEACMPIAMKYSISYVQDYSIAVNDISDFVECYMNGNPLDTFIKSDNKNPKRAICEVFLQLEIA